MHVSSLFSKCSGRSQTTLHCGQRFHIDSWVTERGWHPAWQGDNPVLFNWSSEPSCPTPKATMRLLCNQVLCPQPGHSALQLSELACNHLQKEQEKLLSAVKHQDVFWGREEYLSCKLTSCKSWNDRQSHWPWQEGWRTLLTALPSSPPAIPAQTISSSNLKLENNFQDSPDHWCLKHRHELFCTCAYKTACSAHPF